MEKLSAFSSDLAEFFTRMEKLSLLKKFPLRSEPEITKLKLTEGKYLLSPCGVELQKSECNLLASELIELLKLHLPERGKDISTIADMLINEQITAHSILQKTFKNEGNELRKLIRLHGLAEDLVTFFAVYLARPFREQAASYLLEKIDTLNWQYGYCPVCGHWPALGIIDPELGERTLWCLCCDTKWKFKRTQCVFCLNEDNQLLDIINLENEESYRVHACKKCGRYIKEVRINPNAENFSFDKLYLGTLPLDFIAGSEGYIQESILTVRYDNSDGNEFLMYRQKASDKKIKDKLEI